MLIVPDYAALAGDVEARMLEAHRLWRGAGPRPGGDAQARLTLMGATDNAARENALRWLETHIASTLAVHAMVEGKRDDAEDTKAWDDDAANTLAVVFAPLLDMLDANTGPKDPDWPTPAEVMMDLPQPTLRGQATRLLRDMWWMAMQHDMATARKKPGRWLASVGIVQAHVDAILAEEAAVPEVAMAPPPPPRAISVENATDAPVSFPTINGGVTLAPGEAVIVESAAPPAKASATETLPLSPPPPPPPPRVPIEGAEHIMGTTVALPDMDAPRPPLPGAMQLPPTADELKLALQRLLGITPGGDAGLWGPLGVSRSTVGNYGRGVIAKPRISPEQAQVLRAECTRLIGELAGAEETFARIVR